jgi:hypothetical protein
VTSLSSGSSGAFLLRELFKIINRVLCFFHKKPELLEKVSSIYGDTDGARLNIDADYKQDAPAEQS